MQIAGLHRDHYKIFENAIHLNSAAVGPVSNLALKALDEYWQIYNSPRMFDTELLFGNREKCREACAQYLNASVDCVGFSSSTSLGLFEFIHGIKPLDDRQQILVWANEFPANRYPYYDHTNWDLNLWDCPLPEFSTNRVLEELENNPKTGAVALSWVQFSNGYQVDLNKISRVCSEKNILLIVDAIQALGSTPLDIEKTPIDFLCAGPHKWLNAGSGAGITYINPELFKRFDNPQNAWLSRHHQGTQVGFTNLYQEQPTRDHADSLRLGQEIWTGIVLLRQAISEKLEIGLDKISAHNRQLRNYLQESINPDHWQVVSDDEANFVLLKSVQERSDESIYEQLAKHNILVTVRQGHIRVAPHFYNSSNDIDELIAVIQ